MRFHDRINSWHGQALLNTLWVTKLIGKPIGLCFIYKSAVNYLIRRSGLFDRAYYLEHNQDVAASKLGPLQHYISYGDKEGRHPMPFFDPVYYRKQAKFKAGYANSLLHYAYVGRYQKTSPSPWFDVDFYLRNNKDIARAQIDPLLHYLKWGGKEGRSPCAEFDGTFYLRMYPDVANMNINPLLHYLTQGRLESRQTIPDQNGNGQEYEASTLAIPSEKEWHQLPKRADIDHCDVDIIIPVYKGRSETLRCLLSVLSAKTETAFQLTVINDASPDAELVDDLHRLAKIKLFNLLNNSSNQGFVHTVNLGIQLNPQRNIVLLNSDTEVYDGWLDRLSKAAHRSKTTGTVTPLSNNATICSYPQFLQDNPYPLELSYAELDQMTATVNRHYEVEAPTGVGFCMYIKRDCLHAVGLFDEKTFGKGYGEENDFCQKAIQKGWRNIIAADVFVRHIGAASFQGEKAKRVQNAIKLLSKRYPKYQKDVDEFILKDPLKLARCRLDSARLQRMRKEKNILIVSHNRGGGSERKLQEDIINLTNAGIGVYTLRPVSKNPDKVNLGHPSIKSFPNINPFELADLTHLKTALQVLNISEIHTHSLVDFPPEAPKQFEQLVQLLECGWHINLHDYKVICPRINLADENGMYCGEPKKPEQCNQCLSERGSDFGVTDIVAWRAMHHHILQCAEKIQVPDLDIAARLIQYFPDIEFTVAPHETIDRSKLAIQYPKIQQGEKLKIVIIGAIGKLKGFHVIISAAKYARQNNLPIEFTLMGYSMNDKLMEEAGVSVTGKYHEQDALDKLKTITPHVVWLPSLWPETYSYTFSLAVTANLPVFAFDIGAIARRAKEIGMHDLLMPLSLADSPAKINEQFEQFRHTCTLI